MISFFVLRLLNTGHAESTVTLAALAIIDSASTY
jgi:hypothetical protein